VNTNSLFPDFDEPNVMPALVNLCSNLRHLNLEYYSSQPANKNDLKNLLFGLKERTSPKSNEDFYQDNVTCDNK
jgi:hypothetical protein